MVDRARTGIILVVDDQEGVRALLRRHLSDAGHTVLESGDGVEALHLVRRRNGAVDLILSDVVMPQMNGTELASRIGGEFPEIPVILMSAFTPAGVARVGLGESIVPVLKKPFDEGQLLEIVALALEHPVARRSDNRAPAL